MKISVVLLLAAMTTSGCATVADAPMDTASLTQRLQHTWALRPDAVVADAETTYLPEGVMNIHGHFKHNGKTYTVVASGSWYVKDGYLYYSITHSNIPSMIPDGFSSADKIVRVTDREFTYISSADGRTTRERRTR